MNHSIFKLTDEAIDNGLGIAEAYYQGYFEIVKEFTDYESCAEYYKNGNYDKKIYGFG